MKKYKAKVDIKIENKAGIYVHVDAKNPKQAERLIADKIANGREVINHLIAMNEVIYQEPFEVEYVSSELEEV